MKVVVWVRQRLALLIQAVRGRASAPLSPARAQEAQDIALLSSLAPRRIPRMRQFRYLLRILSPSEQRSFLASIAVFLIAFSLLSTRLFYAGTVAVAADGGSYTEGLVGSPRFINPILGSASDVDRDIIKLVYAGLMKVDADGNLVPDLASQFRVSDDQKTYTFELRDDLRWHDGEPVTIDDVIFSIETLQDPNYKSPLRVTFSSVTIDRIDRRTVSFTLRESFPSFLTAMTVGIIPQHIWYSIPPAQIHLADYNLKPIGAGPFQFSSLTKDSNGAIRNMTLARNESYHGTRPHLDQLMFKFYPDAETAIEALQNKNVEGLGFLPLEYKSRLANAASITLHQLDLPQHRALFFNPNTNELLKDKNIRRALAFAIDRERIVAEANEGNGVAIANPVLPRTETPAEAPYRYDPSEAASILETNSWKLNEETGVRKNGETELRVVLTTADQPENIKTAEIIRDNWAAVGIAAELRIVDRQQIKRENIEPRAYEILLFGQITTSHQDVYAFWHSSQTSHPGNNLAIFANRDVDAALEELRNTSDPERQKELYATVTEKLGSELFAIFLYTPTYLYPVSSKVKGIEGLSSVSVPADRFSSIERWYVSTSRRFSN